MIQIELSNNCYNFMKTLLKLEILSIHQRVNESNSFLSEEVISDRAYGTLQCFHEDLNFKNKFLFPESRHLSSSAELVHFDEKIIPNVYEEELNSNL